jgi:hypothetical protein
VTNRSVSIDDWHDEFTFLMGIVIEGDDASLRAVSRRIGALAGDDPPLPLRVIEQDLIARSGVDTEGPTDRLHEVRRIIKRGLRKGAKQGVAPSVVSFDPMVESGNIFLEAQRIRERKLAIALERQWEREDSGETETEMYLDVAAALEGGIDAPLPCVGMRRTDGWHVLYPAAVNVVFGPPESGKTLWALASGADVIRDGGLFVFADFDHNGAPAILARLQEFGVSRDKLSDPDSFRYASPGSAEAVDRLVADLAVVKATDERPVLIVVDSIGELIPMLGGNTNDADEYTAIHRRVLTALAAGGAAVLAIDHEAKGSDSRSYGATGTVAKKRAVDGVMLRVAIIDPFAPGQGGAASLSIVKDRHGGVRRLVNTGGSEPIAGVFRLTPGDGDSASTWELYPGRSASSKLSADVLMLIELDPPARSKDDVKTRMGWGSDRAQRALEGYRNRPQGTPLPDNTTHSTTN